MGIGPSPCQNVTRLSRRFSLRRKRAIGSFASSSGRRTTSSCRNSATSTMLNTRTHENEPCRARQRPTYNFTYGIVTAIQSTCHAYLSGFARPVDRVMSALHVPCPHNDGLDGEASAEDPRRDRRESDRRRGTPEVGGGLAARSPGEAGRGAAR